MTTIKRYVGVIGIGAMIVGGVLMGPNEAAAGGGQDTATILAKLDQVLAAIGSLAVQMQGVTPNWDKALPANNPGGPCPSSSSRFTCVLGNTAARDNETGLVWASPRTGTYTWVDARLACANDTTGGLKGWRLPSVHELATLVDPTQTNPALPAGHPFVNYQWSFYGYWSATTDAGYTSPAVAWAVRFNDALGQPAGTVGALSKDWPGNTWCVRGGMMNADQY
jgi:hypothetical protein